MKGVHLAGAPIIDADSSVDEYTAGVLKQPLCRLAALEAAGAFDVILKDAGHALNCARWNAADATEAASKANEQVSNAATVVKEKADAVRAALSSLAKARREKEEAVKAESIARSDAASALREKDKAKEAVSVAEANYASAEEKAASHEAARERAAGKKREEPPAARCRPWQPKRPRKNS